MKKEKRAIAAGQKQLQNNLIRHVYYKKWIYTPAVRSKIYRSVMFIVESTSPPEVHKSTLLLL